MTHRDFVASVLAISRQLSHCGIPHAFGGALALGYAGTPRPTSDIDVNVWLPEGGGERVLACLEAIGVASPPEAADLIHRDGQVRLSWETTPVDLFFAYDDLHHSARGRVRLVPFDGGEIEVLSAEDLVVFKALFNRTRDWADIEDILRTRGTEFDAAYASKWIEHVVGREDSRVSRLAGLLASEA